MNYARNRRLYLDMYNKLRLPRRMTSILVKTLAWLTDPQAWWVRRKAGAAAESVRRPIEFPAAVGYVKIAPGQLPHTEEAIAACKTVYAETMAGGFMEKNKELFSKPFLMPLTERCSDLLERDGIRRFVLSPELISIACRYFGAMPILSEVQLLWTPANDTLLKSQKFHLDAEDYKQLKLFLHIEPVDESCGPFTLISAEVTRKVCAVTGYVGGRRTRLEDEAIERIAGREIDSAMGPSGSGILVDTSRCLHYGSRGNRKERLVLFVQFISYFAPKLEPFDWKGSSVGSRELTAPERLLLRV
jgi:hypothetical protein